MYAHLPSTQQQQHVRTRIQSKTDAFIINNGLNRASSVRWSLQQFPHYGRLLIEVVSSNPGKLSVDISSRSYIIYNVHLVDSAYTSVPWPAAAASGQTSLQSNL